MFTIHIGNFVVPVMLTIHMCSRKFTTPIPFIRKFGVFDEYRRRSFEQVCWRLMRHEHGNWRAKALLYCPCLLMVKTEYIMKTFMAVDDTICCYCKHDHWRSDESVLEDDDITKNPRCGGRWIVRVWAVLNLKSEFHSLSSVNFLFQGVILTG